MEAKLTIVEVKSVEAIEKEVSAIIGQYRIDLIKKGFRAETYQMKVLKQSNGQSSVQVHRHGVEFKLDIMQPTMR